MSSNELHHLESSLIQDLHYFPQIKYFTRLNKIRPLDYDKDLSFEELLGFIQKWAKVPLIQEYRGKREGDLFPLTQEEMKDGQYKKVLLNQEEL